MTATVIKVLGLGSVEAYEDDLWVRSYDPDGHGGMGDVVLTRDLALARRFEDVGEAIRVYRTPSRTHPWRSDGKANRPLTAFTVEFETDVPTPDPADHAARPSPSSLSGGVFTTCAEPGCSVPVWREDSPGDGWTSLDEGTWQHVAVDEGSG